MGRLLLLGAGTQDAGSISSPLALPNVLLWAPAAGNGTGGALTSSGGAAGTAHDTPTSSGLNSGRFADITGSVASAASSAQGITIPNLAMAALSNTGAGLNRYGPAHTLTCEFRCDTSSGNAYRGLFLTAAADGLYLHDRGSGNYVLDWYSGGDHQPTTGGITTNTWYRATVVAHGNQTWELYLDNTLTHSFTGNHVLTITNLLSLAGQAYGLNGQMADARYYDRALAPADIALLVSGQEASVRPTRRYQLDDGTTAADSAQVLGTGSAVGTITDLSAAANNLTSAAGDRPIYTVTVDETDVALLGGMEEGIRYDNVDDYSANTGLFDSTVTEFSVAVAGQLWRPYWVNAGADVPIAIVGANNGDYGADAGDSWFWGGYRFPKVGSGEVEAAWEFRLKAAAGGTAKFVRGGYPDVFPHTLTFVFLGSTYMRIFLDGVQIAENTTSIPATLDLSGDFELGGIAAGLSNPSGWQHWDVVAADAAWTPGQVAALHNYWEAQGPAFNTIPSEVLFGAGHIFDGADDEGFNLNAAIDKLSNGNLLAGAWTGSGDPTNDIKTQRKLYTGGAWGSRLVIHEDDSTPTGCYGPTFLQLTGGSLSGRIYAFTSTAPAPSGEPWAGYQCHSTDNGSTFTTPAAISASGALLASFDYWAPSTGGRATELTAGGDIRLPCYGKFTSSTRRRAFWLISTNQGATWTAGIDLTNAIGAGAFHNDEPVTLLLGGSGASRRWLLVVRQGGGIPPMFSRSVDDGVTWTTYQSMGDSTGLQIATAQPNLFVGTSDPSSRIFYLESVRDLGTPTYSANKRPGIIIYPSSTEGVSWGRPTVISGMDENGYGYPSGCDLGDGTFMVLTTDGTLKVRTIGPIPYSLIVS